MQYWNFFPAPDGWGSIPVWGFADVRRSAHPDIAEGERVYGYFPMSTHLVVQAEAVGAHGFTDASPHRQGLPVFYNQYLRVAADPGYDPARENEQMLFRPLFATAFLIDDFLDEAGFFGARQVLLSSASSKTSIALASRLWARGRDNIEVVGLTSPANVDFVSALGCSHRTVAYDDIATLAADTPTVFVDMAGDGGVVAAVHEHFGEALRYSCQVGGTHWDRIRFGAALPGPSPVLFFAPSRLAERLAAWGPAGLQRRLGEAWAAFLPKVDGWMQIDHSRGREAVESVYRATLEGRVDPRRGQVLSLQE
jgi:hypothetical protein